MHTSSLSSRRTGRQFILFGTAVVLALLFFAASVVSPAYAGATIVVDILDPIPSTDGFCSLYEAVENANDDAQTNGDCVAGAGDDIIDLTGLSGTIPMDSPPGVFSNMTFEGPADGSLRLQGNINSRSGFYVANSTVFVRNLIFSDGGFGAWDIDFGNATFYDSAFFNNIEDYGGAIYSFNSTVLIVDCTFVGNTATYQGGAIYADIGSGGEPATVELYNSTLSLNTAGDEGGAIYTFDDLVKLFNVTFTFNATSASSGSTLGTNSTGVIQAVNTVITGSDSSSVNHCDGNVSGIVSTEWPTSSCSAFDTRNPQLQPLGINDSLHWSAPPSDTSPELDTGTCGNGAPADDQLDVSRPQNGFCDRGSREMIPPADPTTPDDTTPTDETPTQETPTQETPTQETPTVTDTVTATTPASGGVADTPDETETEAETPTEETPTPETPTPVTPTLEPTPVVIPVCFFIDPDDVADDVLVSYGNSGIDSEQEDWVICPAEVGLDENGCVVLGDGETIPAAYIEIERARILDCRSDGCTEHELTVVGQPNDLCLGVASGTVVCENGCALLLEPEAAIPPWVIPLIALLILLGAAILIFFLLFARRQREEAETDLDDDLDTT